MTIWDRISHPEDGLTERKPEGAGERDFKETITAFANSVLPGAEGVLFVGVADKTGEILGCKGIESLQKTISKLCSNDCYPPINHRLESREFEGKPCWRSSFHTVPCDLISPVMLIAEWAHKISSPMKLHIQTF